MEATGLRLGSPATTREGTLGRGSWQSRFMAEVERRGLRVDFMAVHYDSTKGSVDAFRNWLVQVYNTYRRPIWVTEFAHIDWSRPSRATYEANAAFAHGAIRMMETLPFVERHAWFAAIPYNRGGLMPEINLVDNATQPTSRGQAFANIVSGRVSADTASLVVDQYDRDARLRGSKPSLLAVSPFSRFGADIDNVSAGGPSERWVRGAALTRPARRAGSPAVAFCRSSDHSPFRR
ncbi:glycoside hydrolase family protein [Roseibacterium beibuensis]|uniref:glycoside hydrolase family protein n=1 Tax=[Roseibacterium] beibuensis TaxID=1193142 RepID=UPI00217DD2C5|nr:glycoside hydrolase family protein [Roseibacterium beibuensis]MCS6625704.1 glycoside hydrolase family protein [Roseibacterium beibuensis]